MDRQAYIQIEQRDGVATILLSNPPMNVVCGPLTRKLYAALRVLEADSQVRALVLTGAGERAFCAGSDINEMQDMLQPGEVLEKKLVFQNKVFEFLRTFPKPTIALLNGYTFGGGLEIAACCDFIVAASTTKLGLPEVKLGVFPSSGGTFRIARRIGIARTKQLVFLGESVSAETALAWGLVDQLAEPAALKKTGYDLAVRLVAMPRASVKSAKALINDCYDKSDAELISQSLLASDEVFCSADALEGMSAFVRKEPPRFA
ncbi:enoyl-CoA hydratase/isomerase family protein [Pseudomonas gingeri]|uniref:Enoyl-CoA hydratase/isomerase family protein n=1 Tax=Pseudomonas gingeri TaxID=117681 RepID=A0A7Y7XHB3_9PSED|nr:enoyl-CoA hydratase/isomerase family protein [Pseudomonas gingeri]NWB99640.1 enoyl-CoA hydratase/isomerase family protein [Pseudomonas gingeri]